MDDKLREIDKFIQTRIMSNTIDVPGAILIEMRLKLTDEAIAQIKQVFADEHYVQVVDNPHGIKHVHVANFGVGKLDKLMTGQEWYDRFAKELDLNTEYYRKFTDETKKFELAHILQAAKRAASIE
jgi:hypothetical protein